MANRRPLDLSRKATLHTKSITLVFVSLFAFAVAASTPRWRQQQQTLPEYRTHQQGAAHEPQDQNGPLVAQLRYYPITPRYADSSDDELYQQLKLARRLLDDKLIGPTQYQSHEPRLAYDQLDDSSLEGSQLADRLAEILQNQPLSGSGAYDPDPEFSLDQGRFYPSENFNSNPKPPLFLASDQVVDTAPVEAENKNGQQSLKLDETYRLLAAEPEKREITGGGDKREPRTGQKLTTLLEDEEDITTTKKTPRNGETDAVESQTHPSTTVASSQTTTTPSAASTRVSYGKVLTTGTNTETSDNKPAQSILSRFYHSLVSYLPFLNQISILNGHRSATSPPKTLASNGSVAKSQAEVNPDDNDNSVKLDRASTKQSVSRTVSNDSSKTVVGQRISDDEDKENNNKVKAIDNTKSNDKQQIVNDRTDNNKQQLPVDDDENLSSLGTFQDHELDPVVANKQVKDNNNNKAIDVGQQQSRPKNTKRVHVSDDNLDVEINEMVANEAQPSKISLIKQANLVLPLSSDDDLLLRTGSNTKSSPDSLLGKYIFAPTQHYYLNTGAMHPDDDGKTARLYSQMAHRSYATKHLQQGDDVYGSYEGLKPAYAFQKADGMGLVVNNKPNDAYFLVMVGAFCVMAMAAVLAAGLFAYRVQQNRKSTSETDYPTYGVVGPNSMNGKCGAAAFVGGYFAGTNGSGGSNYGSKSGSAKHLPDLYSGGSDSGAASLEKASKKTSTSSSEQQVPTTRTTPTGFMANQDAARMYHYQHQKQQMIVSDRNSNGRHTSASDLDSQDENDDGSYTVYECPGLASAHEMEIKNPLFNDDQTP